MYSVFSSIVKEVVSLCGCLKGRGSAYMFCKKQSKLVQNEIKSHLHLSRLLSMHANEAHSLNMHISLWTIKWFCITDGSARHDTQCLCYCVNHGQRGVLMLSFKPPWGINILNILFTLQSNSNSSYVWARRILTLKVTDDFYTKKKAGPALAEIIPELFQTCFPIRNHKMLLSLGMQRGAMGTIWIHDTCCKAE